MSLDRRRLLKLGTVAATGLLAPVGTAVVAARREPTGPRPSPSAPPFAVALPIPPVLRPASTDGGVDRYEIRQLAREVEILPGRRTPVWGYDGQFPGPTIEARGGQAIEVRHHNELPVPTVVHLHGGVTPAEHDGYPLDLVLPVGDGAIDCDHHAGHGHHGGHGSGVAGVVTGSRTYRYPNDQPAATLWYHDHRVDFTGPQVYRGLAGFYLIRDDVEDSLPLPRGDREVPLMITDRWFTADGAFYYPSRDPTLCEQPGVHSTFNRSGLLGDTILVNGAPWPFLEVDAARYRFRVLNASNARPYLLRLDPPPPGGGGIVQIGSELGLLPRPLHHDELLVGAAERYDVVVDFARYPVGTRVVLRNLLGEGTTSQVMRFDVARSARDDAMVPDALATGDEPLDPERLGPHRTFIFIAGVGGGPSTIGLRMFEPDRIDARPRLGSIERWRVLTDMDHTVHMHLGQAQVLSRNEIQPAAQDAGWKDTVLVRGGDVELAVRFTHYRGKYVLHCHNLEHEDMMMMTNIEVV